MENLNTHINLVQDNNVSQKQIVYATGNRLPVSAKKMALMARTIIAINKRRHAGHTVQLLHLINKKTASLLEKVIFSALANGKVKYSLDKDQLFLKEILVGKASGNFKRIMPRARGRADQITKGFCNITVKLEEK